MKPCNFEEKVIWYSIIGTYGFYFTGLLYYVGPAIAWILALYLIRKLWIHQRENTPVYRRLTIPWIVWVWIVSMGVMEMTTILAHADFDLGKMKIIKASLGWAKGWALLALFPLSGCLNIRPKLLYRAVCILGLQSLIFITVFCAAFLLHINIYYKAPLNFLGGADLGFTVSFYTSENNWLRLPLFAPWATVIGYIGNVYFPLCLQEANQRWRWIGITASVLMCWFSGSRANILAFPTAWILAQLLANLQRPFLWLAAGFSSLATGIVSPKLLIAIENLQNWVRNLREHSNQDREALDRLALDRLSEAPITGHGVTEPAPSTVLNKADITIGSHNNWTGLLFINGIVGMLALAVPLFCSLITLVIKSQESKIAKTALHILLIIIFNTLVDSLNITAYLVFPGLIFLGIVFKEPLMRNKRELIVSNSYS